MASPFKDLQEAVYDIKKTVEMDGEQFIPDNHTIWLTQSQWDDVITDPYVSTLPPGALDALVAKKILSVNIALRP